MATYLRRGFLLGLFTLALAGTGCNLLAMPWFFFGGEPTKDPEMKKLARKDKADVKVVILAYSPLETRQEFIQADRELADKVAKHLKQQSEDNEEKLTIVSVRKVEEFKNNHPYWHTMEHTEIGRFFKADYVIVLDINSLSLYENGSAGQLYHGRADLSVTLIAVDKEDDSPDKKSINDIYPKDRAIQADVDMTAFQFREKFLDHVAQRIAWCFASHPSRSDYYIDD